jgi:hypothetical protein
MNDTPFQIDLPLIRERNSGQYLPKEIPNDRATIQSVQRIELREGQTLPA